MLSRKPLATVSITLLTVLSLAACGSSADSPEAPESSQSTASVTIVDNNGTQTILTPPTSVVALDNRTFETLSEWDVPLSAAAVSLMPNTISYKSDGSIVDIGNHREPDLEAIVAVEPDLIINGQRFTQFHDQIAALVPEATILELDPRDGQPFDAELKRQTTALGEIFGKQAEAEKLNSNLDAAIARVKAAYNPDDTVMALNTSGGELGYIAPGVGRTIGPLFDILGLTPALDIATGTDDHQGDDISVEAVAQSNPSWILVMDRDAAIAQSDPGYQPAADLLANSEALANVTAVQDGQIVIMPADTYTNEGIQTYTEFLNSFADALEAKK